MLYVAEKTYYPSLLGSPGQMLKVDGSGCKNKSDFSTFINPKIEDASKDIPCSNALSSSWGMMEIFFGIPEYHKRRVG